MKIADYVIVCLVYFSQNVEDCVYLLHETLHSLSCTNDVKFIIGGDFNARLGSLNQLCDEICDSTHLTGFRHSLDTKINKPGKVLTNMMESLGFLILCGRTTSDTPAQFINKNGMSIPDHVWVNEAILEDIADT